MTTKKVFLSVPMRNRTKMNIETTLNKMKSIMNVSQNDNVSLEFINTIVEDKPPYATEHEAVWYLGKSIELLSKADILVTVRTPYFIQSPGCDIEKHVAEEYDIEVIEIPCYLVMDSAELEELCKKYNEEAALNAQRPTR